jgi:hypothetical protein
MPGAAVKTKRLLLSSVFCQDTRQQIQVTGEEIHSAPLYHAKTHGTLPQGETKKPGTRPQVEAKNHRTPGKMPGHIRAPRRGSGGRSDMGGR